jgi:predicted Zn finger-like uncharacterized protein
MRIVCPSCDATYDVPDAMLAAGPRAVKCARCGKEWTASAARAAAPTVAPPLPRKPAGPMAALEAEPHGRIEPRLNPLHPRTKPRPPPPIIDSEPPPDLAARRTGAGAIAAWVVSLLILIGAGGAAVNWRVQVMAAWPPSERVFAAVGLR